MAEPPVFQRLSSSAQLYTPPSKSPTTVVLLCTWMDAPARAIAKYSHGYMRLFPRGCSILLLTCTSADFSVCPLAVQRRRLTPALAFLLSLSVTGTQIARLRRELNAPSLVPNHTARTYLYSIADRVVRWQDVESHAAHARAAGYAVSLERFDVTPHVAHVRGDAARYWEIVRKSIVGESTTSQSWK